MSERRQEASNGWRPEHPLEPGSVSGYGWFPALTIRIACPIIVDERRARWGHNNVMKESTKRIGVRAALTTLVAVGASFAIFGFERQIIGVPFDSLDIVEVLLIPIAVAYPIASFIFLQSEKLQRAYDQLAKLHLEMAETRLQLVAATEAVGYAESYDQLTGALSREQFLQLLADAHRKGQRDALLLVDADDFKQISGAFGHTKRDEALIEIAKAIRTSVRSSDIVGRMGPDEFAILLKDVSASTAADFAEVIRRAVETIVLTAPDLPAVKLSASIGGALLSDHPKDVGEALAHAGRCVLEARRSGRNRIAFHYSLSDLAFAMARHARPGSRMARS